MTQPARLTPSIVFEDTHLIVIEKPAGLLSQGDSSGEWNLVDWGREHFGRNYVGLVHRLDRNVSGLMVIAKRTKSAERLTKALTTGTLVRRYQALVPGAFPPSVRWEDLLHKDERTNEVRVVTRAIPGAKKALLAAQRLRQGQWDGHPASLVEIELETGRSHQIRVQLAHRKFPIFGDQKYGGSTLRTPHRIALHSAYLSFPHPMSQERLEFSSALPEAELFG